jgi:hypothetical protein
VGGRRGHGEDAIYFDAAKNRFVGAISVGFGQDGKRPRRKVTSKTKAEVRDKLKAAHAELDRGLQRVLRLAARLHNLPSTTTRVASTASAPASRSSSPGERQPARSAGDG